MSCLTAGAWDKRTLEGPFQPDAFCDASLVLENQPKMKPFPKPLHKWQLEQEFDADDLVVLEKGLVVALGAMV